MVHSDNNVNVFMWQIMIIMLMFYVVDSDDKNVNVLSGRF